MTNLTHPILQKTIDSIEQIRDLIREAQTTGVLDLSNAIVSVPVDLTMLIPTSIPPEMHVYDNEGISKIYFICPFEINASNSIFQQEFGCIPSHQITSLIFKKKLVFEGTNFKQYIRSCLHSLDSLFNNSLQ
jgi:hypothetical protein